MVFLNNIRQVVVPSKISEHRHLKPPCLNSHVVLHKLSSQDVLQLFPVKKPTCSHKTDSQSLMDLRKHQDHWPSWRKVNFTTTVRHAAVEMILSDLQPPHLLVISTSFRCMLQYSLLTSLSSRWVRTLFITSLAHLRSTPSHQPPHLVHGANLQLLSPTHLLYSNSRCWVCKTKETKIWHRDNSHLLSFLFFFFWFQCLLDPCLVGWGMYKKPGAGVVMLVQHLFSIL